METRVFCVYNLARGVFLSSKVTAADGVNEPLKILKVLVSGLGLDTETGLWICPLSAIPSVPRLFPFDLLYLDHDQRVVESAEIVPGAEFPRYRSEVASALVLARQTLESTQTGRGDRLIICVEEEIERQIAAAGAPDLEPIAANGRSSAGKPQRPLDKNGTEKGTPVSAVLTTSFSSVVARPSEGSVPAMTSGSAAPAVALEAPVNQTEISPAAAELEPEARINGSNGTDKAETEPLAVSKTNSTKDSELSRLVLDLRGAFAGMAGKAIESTASTSTEETPNHNAKVAIPEEKPVASITETNLDQPGSGNRSVINGQQGGLEDLFSNWVDAPSLSSSWIPRNPRPGSAPTSSPAPASVAAAPTDKNSHAVEPDSNASAALDSNSIPEPVKAVVPDIVTVPPDAAVQVEPANTTAPMQAPTPAGTAIPQAAPTTTFVAGNLGMWRISLPTAVGPVAAGQSPSQTRPTEPVADKESSSAKETISKETPAPVAKAPTSGAEASPSGASQFARAADLPKESMRAQDAAKVREPSETEPSTPTKEKSVLPMSASTQSIAASASLQRATAESNENLKVADKGPAAATPANKRVVEAATTSSREQFPVRFAEMAERPQRAETAAPVHNKVQASQPGASRTKPGISDRNAAAAATPARAAYSTVAPVKSTVPKAQPKARPTTSIERPEANGKSKTGSHGLGERFKRWLNPVVPIVSDRRRAHRRYVPGMVAHYYTGGAPKPHDVADISMTGFYLLTEDRWMPDTMIQMTLQKPCAKGERKQTITVLSKIVRRGSDGVAGVFVMPESLDPQSRDIQPSQATDRFTLARFI
jgi:hypothetical protein